MPDYYLSPSTPPLPIHRAKRAAKALTEDVSPNFFSFI